MLMLAYLKWVAIDQSKVRHVGVAQRARLGKWYRSEFSVRSGKVGLQGSSTTEVDHRLSTFP